MIINNEADHARRVRNIIRVYADATPAEKEEGANWYQAAWTFCRGLGARYATCSVGAAGIVAALSPQVDWDRNLVLADTLVRTGSAVVGQTGANNEKALRILGGERPGVVLGGNKVRAFYDNIVFRDLSHRVTVDRHAYAIAEGTTVMPKPSALSNPTRYGFYEDAYREAAKTLGVHPTTVQATTWVAWRNRKNEHGSAFINYMEGISLEWK